MLLLMIIYNTRCEECKVLFPKQLDSIVFLLLNYLYRDRLVM